MTFIETDSPIISETDASATFEELEAILDGSEIKRSRFTGLADVIKRRRRLIVKLSLVLSGLLLGWLVIGWWLWPVKWINTSPWDLRSDHQGTYVDLVARDYWQSGDVLQAQQALAGWDRDTLAETLATMQAQAPTFEERQRLAALAEILDLPDYQVSTFPSLFGQKAIILSALLAMAPLVVAVALVVSPRMREKTKQPDELLTQTTDALVEAAAGQPDELVDQAGPYQESPDQTEEAITAEETTEATTATAPGASEEEEEEKETEDEDEDGDWWEEDEEEDSNASVGDILMNLFEEEESELPQLQALCKDLPEIKVEELWQKGIQVAEQLGKSNALGVHTSDT
jgi:hypothetical protein